MNRKSCILTGLHNRIDGECVRIELGCYTSDVRILHFYVAVVFNVSYGQVVSVAAHAIGFHFNPYRLAIRRFQYRTIRAVEGNINCFYSLDLLFGCRIDRTDNRFFSDRCYDHGGSHRECTIGIGNLNEEFVVVDILLVNLGFEYFLCFFKHCDVFGIRIELTAVVLVQIRCCDVSAEDCLFGDLFFSLVPAGEVIAFRSGRNGAGNSIRA